MIKRLILIFVFVHALTELAFPATYYIKNGGNDALDGLSDANAWETTTKVNSTAFSAGDDVYFKCDGTWHVTTASHLTVDWAGTSGNRVIIGAYYGAGTIGVSGAKPIFDGDNIRPTEWVGIITVKSVTDYTVMDKYATVENVKIINSEGEGIEVNWCNYVNITNVDIDSTYQSGIQFYNSDNGIIEGCNIDNAGMIYWECDEGVGQCDWPSGISLMPYSGNNIVRNNTIHDIGGEGIGSYLHSDNNTIESNFVYEATRAGIYIENSRGCVVKYNLCYGSHTAWNLGGFGVGLDDEPARNGYSQDNVFFDNFIASFGFGVALWSSHADSVLRNNKVYNNIIVDCKIGMTMDGPAENTEIKNNIIYGITGDCVMINNTVAITGITFDYNLWSTLPNVIGRGAHDPSAAVPGIYRTTDWRTMAGADLLYTDFALQAGSSAINVGVNLGDPYGALLDVETDVIGTQNNQGAGWEIGGDIYIVSTPDETAPTLSSVVIAADGYTWGVTLSEAPAIGAGGSAGWAATMTTAGAITLTFDHISGLVAYYTGTPIVYSGDTIVSGSYTQPGNGVEDTSGNDLATVASFTSIFTNSSAATPETPPVVNHSQTIIHDTNGQQITHDPHGQTIN